MTGLPPPATTYYPPRAHARVPFHSPIELKSRSRTSIGKIENISLGGLLVSCDLPPAVSTEVRLMFNLAAGWTVSASGVVRYVNKKRFGVQFLDLIPEASDAISQYCQMSMGHARRSGRISKRVLVTIKGTKKGSLEELAETLMLSRNGGLLACRAAFFVGERLDLYWPEQKRSAEIEVVSYRPFNANNLLEIGFQFVKEDEDFWQIDLSDNQ